MIDSRVYKVMIFTIKFHFGFHRFIYTFLGLGGSLCLFTCFGHAFADTGNGCCLFSYPFKFQELIRLKINAFLVSFPFMTKFCFFWLVHMMDSFILIFNWFNIYYYI